MDNTFKTRFSYFAKRLLRHNFNVFFFIFPVKNKIVISMNDGKGYVGNGKYIAKGLLKANDNVEIVWLVNNRANLESMPKSIKTVKHHSIRAAYELASSKIWIDNTRKYFYPPKKKSQTYIQTWHASMGLKYLEADAQVLDFAYVNHGKADGKQCDYMLAGSKFRKDLYERAFWFSGQVLESGTPRSDILFAGDEMIKDKVKKHYAIEDKKILLYTPTFRDKDDLNVYALDHEQVLETLKERFEGDWVVLVRLHPKVSQSASSITYKDSCINATDYEDIQELLVAADVLITDYSSTMFDMMLADKMCFLYCYDFEDYTSSERQLYFKISELPFVVSKTNLELVEHIKAFEEGTYKEDLKRFKDKIGNYESGQATDSVVEKIQELLKG